MGPFHAPAAPADAVSSPGCFGFHTGEGEVFVGVPHTHSTTTTAFACIFQCFFCQQVQQSCNSSSASPDTSEEPCPTDMVKMTKSKTFQAYLPSCHRTYSCIHCRAHLANHDELISKCPLRCGSFSELNSIPIIFCTVTSPPAE
ncbi:hypothetical protein INR49_003315, partial [Caranx melampygus]